MGQPFALSKHSCNLLFVLFIQAKTPNRAVENGVFHYPVGPCVFRVTAAFAISGGGGGGCHAPARPYAPVSKPGLLDEGRVPRGVSPGAYRGAQGRSLKNTWKMFVFNCMIHFVICIVTIFPITELLGYP